MKKAHLFAAFTIFVWGTTYISTKILLGTFSPLEIMMLRSFMAVIALYVAKPKLLVWQGWKAESTHMILGITGITLYYLFEDVSLIYTSAANAGVIISLAPFFTAILVGIRNKKKVITKHYLIGFILSMAGVVILSYQGQKFGFNPLGDLIALGAPICWAIYCLTTDKLDSFNIDIIKSTRRIFEYSLVFMIPIALVSGISIKPADFTVANTLNLIYLGFIASALCFILWNSASIKLGSVKASIYIYLTPVVTVVFSAIFLEEPLTLLSILGTSLALAGLIISERMK